MLPKVLLFAVTGAAIVIADAAKLIDEKLAAALFTLAGSVLAFTWATSAKLQKFIDRLERVEADGNKLSKDVAELRDIVGSVKLEIQDLRTERRGDTEYLRKQLKTDALLESVPGITERTGMRILIVDDNEDDQLLAQRKLMPMFIVDTAQSLAQANAKLKKQDFDCVLLDLKLPDARFNRTVEDFVADNPDTLCIVLTGHGDEATRKMCFEQGADDVWVKGQDDRDVRMIKRRITEANWRRHRSQQQKKEDERKSP